MLHVRSTIQRFLTGLVALSMLMAIGEFPVAVIGLALLDGEHEVAIAVEHSDIHVRIQHEQSEGPRSNGPDIRSVPRRLAHDPHGVELPRFGHQRLGEAVLLAAPEHVGLFPEPELLGALVAHPDPVIPIEPGLEHHTPPDLQRTVILLI